MKTYKRYILMEKDKPYDDFGDFMFAKTKSECCEYEDNAKFHWEKATITVKNKRRK